MTSPLFSIIVPTYGRPRLLAEAIQSIGAQTIGDFECIVVDDASPHPVDVHRDPRVRVVRRAVNGGPAAARNTGLALARGRYVAFLDDDDLYTPDRLAMALEGLARAPVSICWMRYHDAAPGSNRVLEDDISDVILDEHTPHVGAVAIDRGIVPSFDERFMAMEDVEWWLRLTQRTRVATVARVGYLFRRHDGPRHRIGLDTRVRCRLFLLEAYAAYFSAHPRAEAFQWKRLGLTAHRLGEYALARVCFNRALRLHPEVRALWHWGRSFRLPSRHPSRSGLRELLR